MLATFNLWLHKIVSHNSDVLEAFVPEDHAKGLQNLDFDDNSGPHDIFTLVATEKPFTHRGVLAMVNSLFDPLRHVAPIIIQGKFLLRKLTSSFTSPE